MKIPPAYPAPPELEGRPMAKMKLRQAPEDLFNVIDAAVPYIEIVHPAPKAADFQRWTGLLPDYFARADDDESAVLFVRGHGGTRATLGRIGLRRAEWERLDDHTRSFFVSVVAGLHRLESALVTLARHSSNDRGTREGARVFTQKFMALLAKDDASPKNFVKQRRLTSLHRKARTAYESLTSFLAAAKREGEERSCFDDVQWRTSKAAGAELLLQELKPDATVGEKLFAWLEDNDAAKCALAIMGNLNLGISVESLRTKRRRFGRTKSSATKASPPKPLKSLTKKSKSQP